MRGWNEKSDWPQRKVELKYKTEGIEEQVKEIKNKEWEEIERQRMRRDLKTKNKKRFKNNEWEGIERQRMRLKDKEWEGI